jgi:hypothetical protein
MKLLYVLRTSLLIVPIVVLIGLMGAFVCLASMLASIADGWMRGEPRRKPVVANDSFSDEEIEKVIAMIEADARIAAMNNTELVAAVLRTGRADNLYVEEMMDRLDPQWAYRKDDGTLDDEALAELETV